MAVDPFSNSISEIVTAYMAQDGHTVTPVSQETPLPVALPDGPLGVALPILLPVAWPASTTMDMRMYSGVTVQVANLSGGDTIQISQSFDGINSNVQSWVKNDFTTGSTISTVGNYSFSGGGYMTYAKTGSGGTPTLTIAGSN